MREVWAEEDIADNWLFLDMNALKREVERKGGKWNLDAYCKDFVTNPKIKLPFVYVNKNGKLFFNETARKWERPEEIKPKLLELWAIDGKPFLAMLTGSLKELAQFEIPDSARVTFGVPKEDWK